jgi:hypothetical protein
MVSGDCCWDNVLLLLCNVTELPHFQ